MQAAAYPIADRISSISVSSTMKVAQDAEKLRSEGVDVVDFGAGEPDFPTPDNIKQAAVRALEQNFTKYTAAGGTLELKKAVCERHTADFGTDYKPAECLITVGGKHIIFNLIQALVNPGDEVVIPVPYWVTYKDVVNYAGGKCVFVDTDEKAGFTFTAAMIEPHLNARTRLVIINSPSNPSGAVLDREEFEKIFKLTSSRGIYLMTDECYCQFLYDSRPFSIASLPGAKETVLVAGSLSKTYAMTGWRVGFGLVPQPIVGAMTKLQSHSTSNPTSIAQKAAVEALRGPQESVQTMLAEYRNRRDFVVDRLRAIPGVTCAEPRGAFYAYPNLSCVIGR
ncbi:MAG: pyridoxal phosphate-dependent aminotransferase, partial [Acidobacteriota bacterium]|nr:pyridoxal phosphate-dependent aminotransferase [Acidobacteriota bacterium]